MSIIFGLTYNWWLVETALSNQWLQESHDLMMLRAYVLQ